MRTQKEIVDRIKLYQVDVAKDFLGAIREDLVDFLDFEHARAYLVETATAETWKQTPVTREAILDKIKGYMSFAWEKADDERGISANRSLHHMQAWLWMLGEEAASEHLLDDYRSYGKPALRAVCDRFGILRTDASSDVHPLPWRDGPVLRDEPLPGIAPNRSEPGADGTIRKAHYGPGKQPWDVTLEEGWGPPAAAFCVLRYLRRDKAVEHSLESARWYWDRLSENSKTDGGFLGPNPWTVAFVRLSSILTDGELRRLRG